MKSEGLLKPVATSLLIALVLYAITYTAIEHRRNRNGPWQVTFTNTPAGAPALLVNQPALAITNVQIVFPGEMLPSNSPLVTLLFRQPRPQPYAIGFGTCLFMDTTFLPGTLVFNLFGHEIQLIPRVLTIDHKEQPWRSDETISLASTNLSSPPSIR